MPGFWVPGTTHNTNPEAVPKGHAMKTLCPKDAGVHIAALIVTVTQKQSPQKNENLRARVRVRVRGSGRLRLLRLEQGLGLGLWLGYQVNVFFKEF